MASIAAVLVALCADLPVAAVNGPDRDWSRAEIAWRDDPRAAADLPAADGQPAPRASRRAARRAARRGVAAPQVPFAAGRPDAADSPAGPGGMVDPLGPPSTATAAGGLAHRDQPYGLEDDPRRRFDIHLPDTCLPGGMPLVVWIAGDSWDGGGRAACPLVWLVERGYAVASVEYRPSAAAPFPAQLDDCRAALGRLARDAALWGIDPARICVVGRGGGGHLAALVALADPPAAAPEVAAACAVAAPLHLPSLGPAHDRATSAASRLVGGPLPELREAAQAASPLAHVSADDPPLLLVHGDRDAAVPTDQSIRAARAVDTGGGQGRLVIVAGAGHAVPIDGGSPGGRAILAFLDDVLGAGPRP